MALKVTKKHTKKNNLVRNTVISLGVFLLLVTVLISGIPTLLSQSILAQTVTPTPTPITSIYGTYPNCTADAKAYETQSWWKPPANAINTNEASHIHLGICLPRVGTNITAPIKLDAVIQLHNNPDKLVKVRWSDGSNIKQEVPENFTCSTIQCSLTVPLTLDPALFDNSGFREVRFTADTRTTNGKRNFNTTRWCYNITNSKAKSDYCGGTASERFGTAGWYTDVEYMNVYTKSADYDGVKSGTWCFNAKFERNYGFASIDPKFHNVPADQGMVVYNGAGNNSWRKICVNTALLTNGTHKLFLRTDAVGLKSTDLGSGVFTLPFTVSN